MIKGLYDSFAKRWYHGGSIWFYSDPHFGDEEMKYLRKNYIDDEEQVKRINSKIGKNDTIIFLGDIGDVEFIKKIRGYKVLVMGNHDKGASNYQKQVEKISKLESEMTEEDRRYKWTLVDTTPHGCLYERTITNNLFDEVYEGILIIGEKIVLSHERVDFRFCFNIHGHEHLGTHKGKNHLNVCAEQINYTPINLSKLIKSGMFKDVEDIHRVAISRQIKRK